MLYREFSLEENIVATTHVYPSYIWQVNENKYHAYFLSVIGILLNPIRCLYFWNGGSIK